jgi:GntR family transcriptional regulator
MLECFPLQAKSESTLVITFGRIFCGKPVPIPDLVEDKLFRKMLLTIGSEEHRTRGRLCAMTLETPRYVQILDVLSRRLANGEYPVEMRMPTERELCDEFGASRFTVREALRRLVEQGMLTRRQGAGSTVKAASPQARYVHPLSSLSDLFQFALNTHYDFLSLDQAELDATTAAGVGGGHGERWWLMKGLRRDRPGGKIVCYIHSYMPPRMARYIRELRSCVGPFYAHLAKRSGEEILEVEQDLSGGPMNAEVARQLRRKRGTSSVCALRRYITQRGTIIASYNWHVAEDFHYRMKISKNL